MKRCTPARARAMETGQSLVELALVLPILLLILLGLIDFGRMLYYDRAVVEAANAGARYAAMHPNVSSATVLTDAVQPAAPELNGATATITNVSISHAGMSAQVQVSYQFSFIEGFLPSLLGLGQTLPLSATSTMVLQAAS